MNTRQTKLRTGARPTWPAPPSLPLSDALVFSLNCNVHKVFYSLHLSLFPSPLTLLFSLALSLSLLRVPAAHATALITSWSRPQAAIELRHAPSGLRSFSQTQLICSARSTLIVFPRAHTCYLPHATCDSPLATCCCTSNPKQCPTWFFFCFRFKNSFLR